MRWTNPAEGARRVRTKFLWFPEGKGGEWRWLERATVEEVYLSGITSRCFWCFDGFVDDSAQGDGK